MKPIVHVSPLLKLAGAPYSDNSIVLRCFVTRVLTFTANAYSVIYKLYTSKRGRLYDI